MTDDAVRVERSRYAPAPAGGTYYYSWGTEERMSNELVIREPSRVLLFSVGPDGTVTHVDEAILDEVAAVLWNHLHDHATWAYEDEHAYEHAYETLTPSGKDILRARARDVLTPLLRRLVVAR